MRAAQQVDGHILDSVCGYDRHQGFWGIALFTISAGLYVMKYVWFIISAVQSIYEVGSGKFGGELTSISLSLPTEAVEAEEGAEAPGQPEARTASSAPRPEPGVEDEEVGVIEEALEEEVEEASVIEGAEADSRVADVINTNLSIFVLVFYCFQ